MVARGAAGPALPGSAARQAASRGAVDHIAVLAARGIGLRRNDARRVIRIGEAALSP